MSFPFAISASLLLFLLLSAAQDADNVSAEDQLVIYLHNASHDDLIDQVRSMGADTKARALETIRENKSGLWTNANPHVLFYLGDIKERKKEIERFREIRWFSPELVELGEPWVIEELAPELYREEPFANFIEGDILNYPLSYGVAGLVIANLQNATIYPDSVLQWAKRTSPHALPQLRTAMRDWWRENAQFFKERNYKAVKPGREVALVENKPAAHPAGVKRAAPESRSLPPYANGVPSPNVSAAPTEEATHEFTSTSSEWTFAAIAAGCLVLLGALIFFWKRHLR